MSKESRRQRQQLPARQQFYKKCAGLAFGRLTKTGQRNWLNAICDADEEHIRLDILHRFALAIAGEMAHTEGILSRSRGRPSKLTETMDIEFERITGGLNTPQAAMKAGVVRSRESASKKATAMRSRRYRAKKKNVTQKT